MLATKLFEAYGFKKAECIKECENPRQYYYSFNFKQTDDEYKTNLRKLIDSVVKAVKADTPELPVYILPTPLELVDTFEQPMSWSRVNSLGHAVATVASARENGIYTITFIVRTCPKSS